MQRLFTLTLTLAMLTLPLLANSPVLKAGSTFEAPEFTDQHGTAQTIPPDTRTLLFAADMDASEFLHELLEPLGDDYLNRHRAVFVADIHRMPGIISTLIAKPRMRDYSYTIRLIEEEGPGAVYPRAQGKITVMRIQAAQSGAGEGLPVFKVGSVEYAENAGELQELIERDSAK